MNQSTSANDGSPTFTIKIAKTARGITASAPTVKEVAPVTARTQQLAVAGLKAAIDKAVVSGAIKKG